MEAGDLIQWRGQVWLVRKVDRELATAVVETARNMEVIASDADSTGVCQVWCTPPRQWPSVSLPLRPRPSRLVQVLQTGRALERFTEWVRLDAFQNGGALYLNPILNLHYGDRLTAIFAEPSGSFVALPLQIPRNFSPLPQRRPPRAPVRDDPTEPSFEPKTTPKLFARLRKRDE